MKASKIVSVLLIGLLSLSTAGPSRADSLQYEDDEWHFLAPMFYMWLFQIDGDVTVKGSSQDVDMSIDDVMENMESGLQLYLELRKHNFGFYGELSYLKFGSEDKVGGVKFDSSLTTYIVDTGLSYRAWRTQDPKPMSLEVLGGVRYWNLKLDIDGNGAAAPDATKHAYLIDPVIGTRFRMDATEKFHLGARVDIGGFDIGNHQSDITWQTWLLGSYDVTKYFSVFGGYRALAVDYDEGSGGNESGADLVFHGPLIGFDFDIFGWLEDRRAAK